MKPIYMDNNATTRVAPEVVEAMLPYFSDLYGNPSSMHAFGGNVGTASKTAREQVATLLGALPEEILFTSCGTESDSTAIHAAIRSNPDKRHIITTRVEHPAVKSLGEHLAENGYRVTVRARGPAGAAGPGLSLQAPDRRYGHRQRHVGQQRNRNDFSRRGDRPQGQGAGHRFSHRCGPGRGQDSHQHGRFGHRHALHVRPQAARAQGGRRALPAQGNQIRPLSHGRAPGRRAPGRHRKHRLHHRHGPGCPTGHGLPWKTKTPVCGPCGTNWKRELLKRVPQR
jgi:hypothetical protein